MVEGIIAGVALFLVGAFVGGALVWATAEDIIRKLHLISRKQQATIRSLEALADVQAMMLDDAEGTIQPRDSRTVLRSVR